MWIICPVCRTPLYPNTTEGSGEIGTGDPPKHKDVGVCTSCMSFITTEDFGDERHVRVATKPEMISMLTLAYPYVCRILFLRWIDNTAWPSTTDSWDCDVLKAIAQKV